MQKLVTVRICRFLTLSFGLIASSLAQTSWAHAEDADSLRTRTCPAGADYLFPSINAVPFADVVLGSSDEFNVSKTASGLKIVHVGQAKYVRFPSIVAVGRTVELELYNPATYYCIDSAVGSFGGKVSLRSSNPQSLEIISEVGFVEH